MKLIHTALVVVAASLLPSAAALEPQSETASSEGRAYTIAVRADLTPVNHGAMTYPTRAASLGQDGRCDVRFDVNADGGVSDVQVLACTSEDFAREASRVAAGLSFPAGQSLDNARLQINWKIEGASAGLTTASLN